MRIAFVRVAELPLQAILRSDPELQASAVAVSDGRERTPAIVGANAAAQRVGVRAGLTVSQAQAVAPEVIIRARSPELERSARAALEDLAASFAPRIEP